ncbi:MAG: ABC transporter substrate-binding protein [Phascolarctobacterium sp.]|nr:ABC transporter substrate-binding protein [Phascolarctobacterium sp.]
MYRKILAVCLVILAICLCGCGGIKPEHKHGGEIIYSVTDSTGQKLSFYEKPQRIISMNVSVDEILLDLIDSKRIAALTYMADDPSICSAGDKVKLVKNRVHGSNIEMVIAMQPDLVIIPDYAAPVINALRAGGVRVYVCSTPDNMQDIFKFIIDIGEAVGDKEAGEAMVAKLQADMEQIREQVIAKVPEKERLKVLCLSFMGPMGMRGTFSDLCYYSGIHNALEGIDIPQNGTLSEEKMLELNPDMIIISTWDYNSQSDDNNKFLQRILYNPVYANVKAIKNGRVVQVRDNYLMSTSQYTYKAAEELAQKAYPEVF